MKYAITNCKILDGTRYMKPIENKMILVEDDIITSIVPDSYDTRGYDIIDLNGSYIMPGLINMHTHLPATGKPESLGNPKKLANFMMKHYLTRKMAYNMCKESAMQALYSGVTTLRTVGGLGDIDTRLRDEFEETTGPRIISANKAISVPGGHMAGSVASEVHNIRECIENVRQLANEDVDFIKIMITGGVSDATVKGEPGVLRMPPQLVKAAVDEAHIFGLKVAAHVESQEGLRVALENGVDMIEHGAQVNKSIISLFINHKAVDICTLSPCIPFALFDPKDTNLTELEAYNGKIVFEGIKNCAKECLKNHILVGLGTDAGCPYVTHYDFWRELFYYHTFVGVSNRFALHTATYINAKILGLEYVIGTISSGKSADMIVTKENPLKDLRALRDVEKVFIRGQIIEPSIKRNTKVDELLDTMMYEFD